MEQQSPIDISGYTVGGTPQLSFEYGESAECVTNTGEFVKVIYENGGGICLGGDAYQVVEAHMHNPSEHTVDGQRFALETHLVHRRGAEIAVVGALYRLGEANAAVEAVIEAAPGLGEGDVPVSGLSASAFLPSGRGYYAYMGSLTTPPYTEGVRWHVLSEVMEVSAEQVERLAVLTGGGENSREVQGLEGREINVYGMDDAEERSYEEIQSGAGTG